MGVDVKRALLICAVALGASMLVAPGAQAGAGDPDRSFDGDGRLVIPAAKETTRGNFEVTRLPSIPMASAAGPRGELVAANNRRVMRYRADGRPRGHFGGDGRVAVPTPAGTSFQLAGVAVDSSGRVVVAGTTEPVGASSGSRDARAGVFRFLPDGRIDRSFGVRGLAGASLGPMEATGIALDSLDRPVLTAFSALTPFACGTTSIYRNTTTVARLTTSGALDRTFGGGGIFTDPLEDPHLPTLTASGEVVYVSAPDQRCANPDAGSVPVASILSPSGSLARRFPVSTRASFLLEATSLAVDRQNRIVILVSGSLPEGGGFRQDVHRLLPDGSPDPEFGVDYGVVGSVSSPGPAGSRLGAVTTDRRNRVILAGSSPLRRGRGFLAVRLSAAGRLQTWFGDDGAAKAGFGKRAEATATQVHLDSRGRIVLGGTVEGPWLATGYGLGFARFHSGG
jgi:uncharacterized delta-60 repeat protein